MNDTQRLDALGEYGLCLATHDTMRHGQWERIWVCQHGDHIMLAPTIREAIDAAVLDIQAQGLSRN